MCKLRHINGIVCTVASGNNLARIPCLSFENRIELEAKKHFQFKNSV